VSKQEKQYNSAAGPVQERTVITTSASGLAARAVEIPLSDRAVPGYFAHPEGQPDSPLLLVLSEAFGLHEHIRDIVRRFSHEGFFAVAPDLMARQGDPGSFSDVSALVQNLLLRIPDEQVVEDLDAVVKWSKEQGADGERVSVSGFCWGGRWSWLYAAHRKMDAAVAWYGILDGTQSDIFRDVLSRYPNHPVDLVDRLKTSVLGLYGGQDDAIPLRTIRQMQAALKHGSDEARRSEIRIYPEAGHAFFADYRATYQRAAAADAWRRCIAWLQDHRGVSRQAGREELEAKATIDRKSDPARSL
jgi:carboxymethylenebutenolidase